MLDVTILAKIASDSVIEREKSAGMFDSAAKAISAGASKLLSSPTGQKVDQYLARKALTPTGQKVVDVGVKAWDNKKALAGGFGAGGAAAVSINHFTPDSPPAVNKQASVFDKVAEYHAEYDLSGAYDNFVNREPQYYELPSTRSQQNARMAFGATIGGSAGLAAGAIAGMNKSHSHALTGAAIGALAGTGVAKYVSDKSDKFRETLKDPEVLKAYRKEQWDKGMEGAREYFNHNVAQVGDKIAAYKLAYDYPEDREAYVSQVPKTPTLKGDVKSALGLGAVTGVLGGMLGGVAVPKGIAGVAGGIGIGAALGTGAGIFSAIGDRKTYAMYKKDPAAYTKMMKDEFTAERLPTLQAAEDNYARYRPLMPGSFVTPEQARLEYQKAPMSGRSSYDYIAEHARPMLADKE